MSFSALEQYFDSIAKKWDLPACQCSVMMDHRRVFYRAAGYRDLDKNIPAGEEDLYWIYSVSKLFTCVAAMQLIDRGMMSLSDPVSRFFPSWTEIRVSRGDKTVPPEEAPTILHLMTMTAGLNYELNSPAMKRFRKMNGRRALLRDLPDALAEQPLDFSPGEHFRYSLCHDILGAIVESVSGADMETYVKKHIGDPLGARDLTFFPTREQAKRFSVQYRYVPETGTIERIRRHNRYIFTPTFASPGAGLSAGIREIALLADALANGGIGRTGESVLSAEAIRELSKNRLTSIQLSDFREMKPAPYGYGLGVRTLMKEDHGAPEGEFGWDGAAGSYVLIDPSRGMSLVYTQHVLEFGPGYSDVHPGLRNALYESLNGNI
ncbi:MAG: beta-lactamase family protein [Clostridiaceae bacterium]|nr:beta-lactamase family protein [Clostridiaceae bacterium]